MTQAAVIADLVGWWMMIGTVVAALFLTIGIDRIDEDARGAYVFRPLLIPAILVIWPLVLWRWWVLETGRDDWSKRYAPPRRTHLVAALAMTVLMALALVAGLSVRQTWPADIAPQQLSVTEETE